MESATSQGSRALTDSGEWSVGKQKGRRHLRPRKSNRRSLFLSAPPLIEPPPHDGTEDSDDLVTAAAAARGQSLLPDRVVAEFLAASKPNDSARANKGPSSQPLLHRSPVFVRSRSATPSSNAMEGVAVHRRSSYTRGEFSYPVPDHPPPRPPPNDPAPAPPAAGSAEPSGEKLRTAVEDDDAKRDDQAAGGGEGDIKEVAEAGGNSSEAALSSSDGDGEDAPWMVQYDDIAVGKAMAKGAFATVYMGEFRGEKVAVKVLKGKDSVQGRKGFKCELDILYTMRDHPHIIKTYGGCLKPQPCLIMEFCSRGSVYDWLTDPDKTITWPQMLKAIRGALDAITFLHLRKPQILHRDLKTHNLLVDDHGTVKLCDFGLSRYNTAMNHQSLLKARGSYEYMAPEVLKTSPHTASADVYSMGIIMWELAARVATGEYQIPYKEYRKLPSMLPVLVKIMKGVRPTIPEGVPEAIVNLIKWCWHPDPPMRPGARQVLEAIDECLAELESGDGEEEPAASGDNEGGEEANSTPEAEAHDGCVRE